MRISPQLTDEALLREIGKRLAKIRIDRDYTQADLAEQAGVSKRTIERLETGAVAPQLSVLLRVCRALDLLEGIEHFLPETGPSPMAQLKNQGKARKRARGKASRPSGPWTWEESS